jgi:PAS domain S-box-containing protein
MAGSDREQRLLFLELTERDAQLLRALRPLVEKCADELVAGFYQRLMNSPQTARLLRDQAVVERLNQLQRDYLLRITDGRFDDAYFNERLNIGRTHERIGLASHWYLLAYNHHFAGLSARIRQFYADNPALADDTILALQKVFMLDASLAMDAYIAIDRYRRLQQLESIVNDSGDVIFFLDNDKRFRAWNRAAAAIFGWRADEILGQPVEKIVPPDVLASQEMERIDRDIEQHGHCHLETVRLAKDGRRVPVELTVSLLRDPQGQPIGRSAILRDITERRRLEEEKLQAERLAVIGAMSAKLAHEIRNPLSSVALNIDLVRDEVETLAKSQPDRADEARALLRSIDSEMRRIQRVTEDYLQFARMPKPRRERVALNDLLTHGLSFLQSSFDAAGVAVRTQFEPQLPAILGDEEQLWQAILNLLRNAIEAMPDGGALALTTARNGSEVALAIADTGKGMTDDERRQIFKPFFSTKAGGTGLGLPLALQVVTEHGGHIECESAPGKGATFTIRLPLTS